MDNKPTEDNPRKSNSHVVFLITEVAALLILGLSTAFSTVLGSFFILSLVLFTVLPVLGIGGAVLASRCLLQKRGNIATIFLLMLSILLVFPQTNIYLVSSIAHTINPQVPSPTEVLKEGRKASQESNVRQELTKAHYKYYQNLFKTSSVVLSRKENGYVLDTNMRFKVSPIGARPLVDDGPLDKREKQIAQNQQQVIEEISGKSVRLELPPYNVFSVKYQISFEAVQHASAENLDLYKDPNNPIWDTLNHDNQFLGMLIVPVHIYYEGRDINKELIALTRAY